MKRTARLTNKFQIFEPIDLRLGFFVIGLLVFNFSNDIVRTIWYASPFKMSEEIARFAVHPLIFFFVGKNIIRWIKNDLLQYVSIATAGVILGIFAYKEHGIINFTWVAVISSTSAVVLYLEAYIDEIDDTIKKRSQIKKNELIDVVNILNEELKYFLDMSMKAALSLAAILGVCMTILFKDGYDESGKLTAAVKIILAFFIVGGSLFIWIAYPIMEDLRKIRKILMDNVCKKSD